MSDAHVTPHPYHPVRVTDAWDETDGLRGVRLDFGALGAAHTRPGQVIKLQAPGHRESYFALANAPRGDGTAELLLKRGSPLADAVIAATHGGGTLQATAPFGTGFPVEQAEGRDVLLFANGSGITSIRSLLQWLLA